MFLLVFLFLILSLLFLTYFYMHNTEHGKLIGKIPGDEGLPLIGSLLKAMKSPQKLFYKDRNLASRFKHIYKARFLHVSSVIINDPDDIETLLNTSKFIDKAIVYSLVKPWLGDGLLLSSGEKWRTRRKLLTNSFHFSILKDACRVFDKYGKLLVEDVKKTEGKELEINNLVAKYSLFAICQSAMGISLENNSKGISEYRQAVHDMAQCILYKLGKLLFKTNFIIELTPMAKFEKRVLKILHGFSNNVLQEREKNNNSKDTKESEESSDDEYKPGKKRLAMLDLLLSMEKEGKIDKIGIREEVDTFTFAGHDTTTSVLNFFILNLANHRDIQDRLVEELKNNIYSVDDKVTMNLINQLPYLDRCFKESMRIYPPVPFFSRHLNEDLQLKNYLVPKDTSVSVFIFDLHRDYRLYPDPFKYDPERFTPENCAKRHPFAYIPFSAGPRNCIGQKYAAFEIKSFIITLLRNFVILPVTTPNELRFAVDFVLVTSEPIKVKLQQRDDPF